MKKFVVRTLVTYRLKAWSNFLNDYLINSTSSSIVVEDTFSFSNLDEKFDQECFFLNSHCYRLFSVDNTKFSRLFLDSDFSALKFSAACEFVSRFRNFLSCVFSEILDGLPVQESYQISDTTYNFKSSLCIIANVKIDYIHEE